ncbi:hypothetical protein ATN84_18850 [Paramesorhizobium deserti]|uniref:Oxidoreductase n=1 Tax=Paramesorhizobium deserti TaxID=1494590 RepID=A0A135HQ51_9HYPH|nr:NAD(P)-dependent oxidoreductase [Paramesorhizobium deserti]KXF75328.1 hypothetical protein ATN84_18850 [Paramesorhizobium deserti]
MDDHASPRIGFIGLGGMGRGLVKNMLKHGLEVTVHDLDEKAVERAVDEGARRAEYLAAMAREADVLAICITTAEAVRELALSPGGLLDSMREGTIFLDHTTVSPQHVDLMRRECEARGIAYAEAPMTRTPAHADRGEVNILFGGESDLLERLRPIFDCYAENVFHVGPAGHAIRLKLIHNYIAFANVASWCEGFALAAREGLDMSKVIGIISAAGGRSGMMDLYGEMTLKRDFTPHMSLANAQKDVRYYAHWLEEAGLPGFMAEAVHQTYALASIMGHAGESCTAVIKAYEQLTGIEARLPDPKA